MCRNNKMKNLNLNSVKPPLTDTSQYRALRNNRPNFGNSEMFNYCISPFNSGQNL